jgi:hypothetical protein
VPRFDTLKERRKNTRGSLIWDLSWFDLQSFIWYYLSGFQSNLHRYKNIASVFSLNNGFFESKFIRHLIVFIQNFVLTIHWFFSWPDVRSFSLLKFETFCFFLLIEPGQAAPTCNRFNLRLEKQKQVLLIFLLKLTKKDHFHFSLIQL